MGLKELWFFEDVVFDTRELQVDIYVGFRTGARLPCPECEGLCPVHDTAERTWRHLNFFQYPGLHPCQDAQGYVRESRHQES